MVDSQPSRESQALQLAAWFRLPALRRLVLTVVAILVIFVIVFPFLWVLISSFRDPNNFLTRDLRDALPTNPSLESYALALQRSPLPRWVANSLGVALATTALSLLVAAPMAFALARLRFRGRQLGSWLLVVGYAIPSVTLAIPIFVILVRAGLNNTFTGLILVHATFTIPFSTWVLRDFYRSIPHNLDDAGYVDGASLVRVLRHIILPLSIPGLLAAGTYSFILSWNDFLFALIVMGTADKFTAPVGIHAFFTGQPVQSVWAQLMAATSIVSLPSVILFGFFQRYLVSGFLAGAVKG